MKNVGGSTGIGSTVGPGAPGLPPGPPDVLGTWIRIYRPVFAKPHYLHWGTPVPLQRSIWLCAFTQRGSGVHSHVSHAPFTPPTPYTVSIPRRKTGKPEVWQHTPNPPRPHKANTLSQ